MQLRSGTVLAIAVLAAPPVGAHASAPRIVLGEGVAGVSPGMTAREVVAMLGRPVYPSPPLDRSNHGATCGSNGVPRVDYFYPRPSLRHGVTVEFKAKSCQQHRRRLTIKGMGRVTEVIATAGSTDDGIRIGARFAPVKAKLGARAHPCGMRRGRGICFLPAGANHIATRLRFAAGRLTTVELETEPPASSTPDPGEPSGSGSVPPCPGNKEPPNAYFVPTYPGSPPFAIAFSDSSYDPDCGIATWSWDFGDPASGAANTSSEADPTHVYPGAGTYTVMLTVTDYGGLSSSASQQVTVDS